MSWLTVDLHLRAHDDCGDSNMEGDDRQHGVRIRAAIHGDRPIGGVSEHITLLHLILMKGMLHHYVGSAREKFCRGLSRDQRLAAVVSRATVPSLPMRFISPAISGPLSRPVRASRSGWNNSRPFLPVDCFSSSVRERHGSDVQSSCSAIAAASLTSCRSSWLSSGGSISPWSTANQPPKSANR